MTVVRDRHGRLRYRLRRKTKDCRIDCYLPGIIGSTEFRAAYEEALEGARVATRGVQPGTIAYVIEAYLGSVAYRNLAPLTRKHKLGRLDWIRSAIGEARYSRLEARHVEALMAKKGGPVAANRLRKDVSQLYRFAAKRLGYKGENPARLADAHNERSGGFHTWTDEEIGTYRSAHLS